MSQFYNVVTRKVVKTGTEEKILHHRVGNIKVTPNGGWFLQLYHLPETEFQIFAGHNSELPVIQIEEDES
jgi:hypothetical protein